MATSRSPAEAGKKPQEEATSGWRLGNYEAIAEVARGGMGRVYLARRIGAAPSDHLYAIKVIHERMLNDPEALNMLIDEASIASKLHHPNIVPILEFGESNNRHFVVMDYVDGFPFHRLLKKNPNHRPPELLVPILLDGLQGLHAAHELTDENGNLLNLVHRDFAPDNLLIDVKGACRVIDFGIAKIAARRMAHTQDGMHKGKLSYMSPEQLSAAKGIDRRADIWTAGVVLYEALTGVHPFRGESAGHTISNILRVDPEPPSCVGLKPPPVFDAICHRAIQRSRGERFTNAAEMAQELRAVAEQGYLGEASAVAEWVRGTFRKDIDTRDAILKRLEVAPPATETPLPVFPRSSMTGSWEREIGILKNLEPESFEDSQVQSVSEAADLRPDPPQTQASSPNIPPPPELPPPGEFKLPADMPPPPDLPPPAEFRPSPGKQKTPLSKPSQDQDKPLTRGKGLPPPPSSNKALKVSEPSRPRPKPSLKKAPTSGAGDGASPSPPVKEPKSPAPPEVAEPPKPIEAETAEPTEAEPPEGPQLEKAKGDETGEQVEVGVAVDDAPEPPSIGDTSDGVEGAVWLDAPAKPGERSLRLPLIVGSALLVVAVLGIVICAVSTSDDTDGTTPDQHAQDDQIASTAPTITSENPATDDAGHGATPPSSSSEAGAPTAETPTDDAGTSVDDDALSFADAEIGEAPTEARVTLNGLPEDARVRLDGVEMSGSSFTVPVDDEAHTIRVDVFRFRPWVRRQKFTRDLEFDVALKRQPTKGRPHLARDPGF